MDKEKDINCFYKEIKNENMEEYISDIKDCKYLRDLGIQNFLDLELFITNSGGINKKEGEDNSFNNFDTPIVVIKKYLIIEELGHGSYGNVYLCLDKQGKKFALKKFFFDKYKKSNYTVNNQLEILKSLIKSNSNKDSFTTDNEYFPLTSKLEYLIHDSCECLIMDYYKTNLLDILNKYPFNLKNEESVLFYKCVIYQLLNAFAYLHNNKIIHRDIKPENIMIDNKGELKVIDFDLVKDISGKENDVLTRGVGTLYYKPGEMLFGQNKYNYTLDLWAIGCLIAEIYLKYPIFKSENELDLLDKITNMLGVINESSYPGVSELDTYFELDTPEEKGFDKIFNDANNNIELEFKSLIKEFLQLDPKKRNTCDNVLENTQFFNDIKNIIKNNKSQSNNYENLSLTDLSKTNIEMMVFARKVIIDYIKNN